MPIEFSTAQMLLSVVVMGMHVTVTTGGVSTIDSLFAEWTALCAEGPSRQTFFTPAYLKAWLSAFAPNTSLMLITARKDGNLRGVLPLLDMSSPKTQRVIRRLRSPSNFYSGRADLVHGLGDDREAAAAIWTVVNTQLQWDILEFRDVAEGGAFGTLVDHATTDGNPATVRKTMRSPYISFSPEDNLASFGPQSRMKRSSKSLGKLGTLELKRVSPVDDAALQRFFDLEASGWKGEAGTAIALDPAALAFYSNMSRNREPGFTPVIYELQLNGETIAAEIGTQAGTSYFNHKRAYNEAYRKHGPGHILIRDVLFDLGKRGVTEFDLLGNDEAYKLEWSELVRQHYHYIIFRNSLKGQAMNGGLNFALPRLKSARRYLASTTRLRATLTHTATSGIVAARRYVRVPSRNAP